MQNGFVESLNGRLRDECLNETLFTSLQHARIELTSWREDTTPYDPTQVLAQQRLRSSPLKPILGMPRLGLPSHQQLDILQNRDSMFEWRKVWSQINDPL